MIHRAGQQAHRSPNLPRSTLLPGLDDVVIQATGIRKSFGGNLVLADVEFSLRRGEVVLLRGDNGSGKTTLLNILTGNLRADAGTLSIRTSRTDQVVAFGRNEKQSWIIEPAFRVDALARSGIGRSWQDARLFTTQALLDNVAVAAPAQLGERPWWPLLRRRAVRRQEEQLRASALDLLSRLGLADRAASSADRISLGQSKRVVIARSVHAGAEVLLLDEPLAGLDSEGAGEVLRMLRELSALQPLTLVIVEHPFNVPHVLEFATTVWTLADGRLVMESAAAVRERLSRNGITANNSVAGFLRQLVAHGRTARSIPLERGATLTIVEPANGRAGPELLRVQDLVIRRGRRTVVGVSTEAGHAGGPTFSLSQGEMGILASPNGWGKTTLLEALAGVIPSQSGTVAVCGEEISHLRAWERARRGLSLCRAREQGFSDLSVTETLQLSEVHEASGAVRPFLTRRVAELSGGERQKVALACVLDRAPRPTVVLLDEPFSALDPAGLRGTWDALVDSPNSASLVAVPSTMQETAP